LVEALRAQGAGGEREFRLATITQASPLRLQFDGEDTASTRTYTRLASYTVTLGDRVLCGRIGTTWTVLGKVI
jgi:hypothetical protein